MKKYTKSDPTFNEEITITEPTDPGHADNINAAPKQIFENTLANKKEIEKGDSKERTITFTSGDVEGDAATEWSDVEKMVSGEKHKSLFNKISTMFKNVRYLYNVLGSEDLSQIGAGTVTGIVAALKQAAFLNPTNNLLATILGTSLDAVQGRILKEGQDALQDQITQINSDLILNSAFETWIMCYKIKGFGLVTMIPRSSNNQSLNITYARVYDDNLEWSELNVKEIRATKPHILTQFFVVFDYINPKVFTDGKAYLCDVRGRITNFTGE